MRAMEETPNHEYNVPAQGQEDWHEPLCSPERMQFPGHDDGNTAKAFSPVSP
jgi:hypothetical protein